MAITVNGVEITDDAIHAEMQHHHLAPSRQVAEYSAKLALVAKELLSQEANRLEIFGQDGEARIAALLEREVGTHSDQATQHQAISRYLAKLLGCATINGIDLIGVP
jgi:hypothetical protein